MGCIIIFVIVGDKMLKRVMSKNGKNKAYDIYY